MRTTVVGTAMVAGLWAIGCGGEGTVRIDSELANSVALAQATQVGTAIELPTAGGVLVIDRTRIAVSEVELEGEEEDDEGEFEMGPRVVEVALDGAATEVVSQNVAEGTYAELGLELMVGAAGSDPAFADFGGTSPASILVDGSYEGAPFTYRSTVAPELEFNLDTPVEVSSGSEARIAVTFDVAAWFLAGDGATLDPTDPGNQTLIEQNILGSMAAHAEIELEDDD